MYTFNLILVQRDSNRMDSSWDITLDIYSDAIILTRLSNVQKWTLLWELCQDTGNFRWQEVKYGLLRLVRPVTYGPIWKKAAAQ